jgi:glutamate dehydrogenase/leucine dehydrogenase
MFDEFAQLVSSDKRDFHQHEAVFMELGSRTGVLQVGVIHKSVRGQAAGGVRYWEYSTMMDFCKDALRLAQGMGRKNALAGLWWGGGKGIIARDSATQNKNDPVFRRNMFLDYGSFITSLRGCYVTAEDAGVTPPDLNNIFAATRFVTSIPPAKGGSGNPSVSTGLGVVCAMEAAMDYLGNKNGISGARVAVQGSGNVARHMTRFLVQRDVGKVILTDIDEISLGIAADMFKNEISAGKIELRKVVPGDVSILFEPNVDIVSPCALGGSLNSDTIPNIKAKVVCGAANNQLLDDQVHDKMLKQHGKIYIPDYLANRMGIVNCANEQYGYVNNDDAIQRHFGRTWENSIFVKTLEILSLADKQNISSAQAANKIADELANCPHPIWGHRSWNIIQSLIENKWHTQGRLTDA